MINMTKFMFSCSKVQVSLLHFLWRGIELEPGVFLVHSSFLPLSSSFLQGRSGTVPHPLVALLVAMLLNELSERT